MHHFKPFKNIVHSFLLLTTFFVLTACEKQDAIEPIKKEILIYCGMTMAQPMREIGDLIQEREDCIVKIIQNGSGSLYRSIEINQQGDLFLPGTESYIEQGLQSKLLTETVYIASNRAALVVAKGNPLRIPADLKSLLNPDYRIVLGSPDSSAIGRETEEILVEAGIYDQVILRAKYLTSDSKELSHAIISNDADLVINWHATSTWPKNRDHIDTLVLSDDNVLPHKLILGLLSFSSQPEISRRFMALASSPEGQAIFAKYGFGE